ncbi:hypothetical protein KIW84_045545 [Lathyrus oleraceus]|uniref:PB1-like domain-containing protein n=1 Tax=Pisum sativum TaxID=3888 RepID=A0A9D4XIT3_PEA|nr:hypothetical protein KIW84_045545 [Pisum sativum]
MSETLAANGKIWSDEDDDNWSNEDEDLFIHLQSKKVWQIDHDLWSYFEVLGGLKDLGYPKVESLCYYYAMDINELVVLKGDAGTNRMKLIALINGNVHLYVMHPVNGKKSILSLENNVGSNGVEEDNLEDDTLDDLKNGVKRTFDDFGTFEDLNNLGHKFDEGGTTGVEDSDAVDQESSCEDVNLDGTTGGIDQKDSCQDVNFEGVALSEDAMVDITLEGTIDYMVCD